MPLLMAPAALLLILVYAVPVGGLLVSSFSAPGGPFVFYGQILHDKALWLVLGRTFTLAGEVTLLCALLGYPVAYIMLVASERWQRIIAILILLPIWTSVLVRAYAWMVLLGRTGLVNQALVGAGIVDEPLQILYTRFAVVVGLVHVMLPYFVFPLLGVMKRIDLRLVAAAQSLGAGRISAFLFVFFPLSLPGVASGGILVFILAIGFFVTPALLGGLGEITYVMLIETQVNQLMNWGMAAAMSVVLLATTLILVFVWSKLLGFGAIRGEAATPAGRRSGRLISRILAATASLRRRRRRRVRQTPRGQSHWLAGGATVVTVLFILLPILIFFPLSFSGAPFLEFPPSSYSLRWYANYFARADWLAPTVVSFEVALLTMGLAMLVGTPAAIAVARGRFRGVGACLGFLTAPAITPTLIIAVGLYFQFARLRLIGTIPGLVLAHLVIAIPLVVIVVLGALRRVDEAPERAARSLGAHPVRAFLKTTLHLIRPSILSAAFFAFLASFDDVVMALFLSGTSASTLPKRMWEGVRLEIDPTVAAVSSLLIVLSIVLLSIAEIVNRRAQREGAR